MKVKYKLATTLVKKPERVFEKKKDTIVVNNKIATAAKNKRFSECLSVFASMKETGHMPTKHTYTNMINGAVRCGKLAEAERFYAEMKKKLAFCVEGATALLKGYFECNQPQKAVQLWQEIASKCQVGSRTVDTYMRGCLYNGMVEEGKKAFEQKDKSQSTYEMFYKLLCIGGELSEFVQSNAQTNEEETIGCLMAIAKNNILIGKEANKILKQIQYKIEDEIRITVDKFTKHKLNEQMREIRMLMNAKSVRDPKRKVFMALEGLEVGVGFRRKEDMKELLTREGEKVLEICSGVGEWIVEKAKKERGKIFFASEIRVDRCFEIMMRMYAEGVENLFILCGDINRFTDLFPDNLFSDIHVNFPEPPAWHEKDTDSEGDLLTAEFLERILKLRTGRLCILSDNKSYMEAVARRLGHVQISKQRSDGTSYFDRMFGKKQDRFEILI